MNPNSFSNPGMDWARIPEYVMNTLCRICAKKATNLIPIFKDEFLPQKILKCLPIKISASDDLPRNICESCFQRVDQSYSLYETAHKSNGKLKKLWKILLKETFHQSSVASLPENNINKDENKKAADNNPEDLLIVGKTIVLEIFNSNNGNDPLNRGESKLKDKKEKEVKLENSLQFIPGESKEDFKTIEKEDESKSKSHVRVYQCQFCFRQLTTPASLSIHESTHSQHRPFLCDTCGKSFKHANNLRCHIRTHLIIKKKHTCIICNKEFLTKFFLQEHMNSHTGETPYKCDICKKEFREKVHLRQHKWSHSLEKFTCPICCSKFNRKGNMKEHIKKFHKSHSEKELCEFKPFGNSSSNEMSPKLNIRGHVEEKKFSCLLCGKKFRHSGSLTYHRRTAHTGEKPFQCSYCNQKFSLRSVQKIHERKTHTFERPYRCSVCSRMFTNSSSLRNHLFIHSKQKMFECKECGKKFTRSSNLSVHMKIHTGDRQFACDQCGKTYIQKHDLLKHVKIHDPKSKPFFCKYCGNSFSNKKDSAKHSTCQFDSLRKFHSEGFTAEKILESVSADFHQEDVEEFLHQEDIIMASMEEISRENIIT